MCLAALALDQHKRFPLVIAANRDEFFARPAARLAWWRHRPGSPEILGGRDLEAGGTWLGLSAAGRLGLLTNVRDPARQQSDAPSRGDIIPTWLAGDLSPDKFWMRAALGGYNDFNLWMADFLQGECWWVSNREAQPRRLDRGIYGLSNAALDTPWPKVEALKQHLQSAIEVAEHVEGLARALFSALADRQPAPDADLPSTGVPLALERELSPAFIRTSDGRYGTRCSTLIITERQQRRLVTHVMERSFASGPGIAVLRTATLPNWPPRYTQGMSPVVVSGSQHVTVDESEVPAEEAARATSGAPALAPRIIRPRARSLIKPTRAIR